MAVQKYLEELSVQQLIGKYNFIVPEIQREYVWGNNDDYILDKFFTDIKEAIKENTNNEEDTAQVKVLEKILERADDKDKDSIRNIIDTYLSKKDLNIGFLYSYRPYYNYNDLTNDVYLIDGQQRLTTLFLALFYFSLKEFINYEDFQNLIRFDAKKEKIGFDYRVRTLTHNFLIDLINHCSSLDDLKNVSNRNWFLAYYSNDVTIKAMLSTIEKLDEHFKNDNTEYYQFVKKQIRFWHFKTEETSQGEELYITMNSRGQQLADNETIRAKLFENEKVKVNQIEWGAKWEIWQDFFWKNREKDGNADSGLNQFLRWVNVIECFSSKKFKTRDLAEKEYKKLISENQVLDYVSLYEIEPYFDALNKLKEYSDKGFFNETFFRNNFSSIWLNGNLSQIHLLKLIPALMYVKSNKKLENLNRFVRFFHNATNDIDIAKNPDNYIIESIELSKLFLDKDYSDVVDLVNFQRKSSRLLSSEEVCKLKLYKQETNVDARKKLEESFWKAEDFKFSKSKIGHLLQLTDYKSKSEEFVFNRNFDYELITTIDINKFNTIFSAYSELINNEEEIWGDLLITSVYVEDDDRLYAIGNWHLDSGFLQFVLERMKRQKEKLNDILVSKEKYFVKCYKDIDDLASEESVKDQVYIYYILHKRLLNKWNWSKWNFGVYNGNDYPDSASLFITKYIYQFYNSQWRYNVGYESGTGIWIQDNFDAKRDYFKDLINWANN
jgi:uncharacterized protein with ParB-like and HNH nuclease domain